MLGDLGIRSKLLGLIALPTLLLLVLSSAVVWDSRRSAADADGVRELTATSLLVNRVVHALQEERRLTLEVSDGLPLRAGAHLGRRDTDVAVRGLREALQGAGLESGSSQLSDGNPRRNGAA
jgi:hypothetical protein